MEVLIVIGVIIFIAAPIITLIMLSSLRNNMNAEFNELRKRLESMAELVRSGATKVTVIEAPSPKAEEKPVAKPVFTPVPPVIHESPKPVPKPEPKPEVKPELVFSQKISIPTEQSSVFNPEAVAVKEPPRPGFFERNPDLEKFIGENLANKIGIGILVIGIGFFVKYAIDQEWINEIGRVFIGILCGGILLGVAHRLRKTFTAFSSVLVGGGIAVLYLTIYIAFHVYHMFSPPVAFLLMVGITGFAVLFSLAYNKVELALVALLGGFASPMMVSTGEGNYVVLFIYITILDVGMLVLSYYKKWPIINIVSYVLTILLYGTWLSSRYDYQTPGMMGGALVFATGFYLVFFAMNLINNLKERKPFGALEFGMLLSDTFFYYGAGMYILNNPVGIDFRGLFTVALGVFNFGFAYSLYKNSRVDKNLVFLLIGLVLTFISLAAPIQLKGNYITLFWAAEAVLLLWLSQKSGIKLMKITSYAVTALMVVSLMMDLKQVYGIEYEGGLPIIFNKGYLTSLFAVASFVGTLLLFKNEKQETSVIGISLYRNVLTVAAVVLVYIMNLLELRYHVMTAYSQDLELQMITIASYNMLFLLVLLLVEGKLTVPGNVRNAFAFIGVLGVIVYAGVYKQVVDSRYNLVTENISAAFNMHYLLVALVIPVCAISIMRIKKLKEFNLSTGNAYSWFYVIFFVFLASTELDNLVLLLVGNETNMEHVFTQNHKIGFPILWGITSFLLIAIGLKWKLRHLRIISMTLFLVTLVKLFAVDIRGISEGGKIAAFISLGILLLTVSFMYQRLKKLLLTEDPSEVVQTETKPAA
ncbi:MAG TPA: DUF2339 domain-containing protein [Cyclobacteriaceae bacterium]|nr:DUF2339 domain-containing protein [Cyclobacteriaceae bacterium]